VDSREGADVSVEENKAVVRRAYEEVNRGDLDAASGYVAPDMARNGETAGREADKRRDEAMLAAFPDLHYDIEDLVAEGDTVVARWRMTGTHEGDLAGPTMSVPPSGKRIDLWGMSLYRIEGGMATEIWESFDMMEFLGQLGVIRSPGQPEEASPA
jgi:predicted ester cyclase